MEIFVEGKAEKLFKPDQITLHFNFSVFDMEYGKVLEKGSKKVANYLEFLLSQNFSKDDFKTHKLSVTENRVYDEKERKYKKNGYLYNQGATLKFDYDMERLAHIMEETSKGNFDVTYTIDFNIKDEKLVRDELLKFAFADALEQAKSIADAGNLRLVKCVKTSFERFSEPMFSRSRLASMESDFARDGAYRSKCASTVAETVQNTFIPEDVIVSKNLYCVWIAD